MVDNAFSDGNGENGEMVSSGFSEVELVQPGGDIGFAGSNNLAAHLSEVPCVLFLNSDTEAFPGTDGRTVRFLEENRECGADDHFAD